MRSKLIRVRNVCLLTGRHHIGEQPFRIMPEVVTADRFGVVLMWDDARFPFLKVKLSTGGQEVPRGREGFPALAQQLQLPSAMQTPPRGLGWCCMMSRNEILTISGYVDTNDAALYEIVRNVTGDFQDQNQVITLSIPGVIVAGQESEQIEFEIALMPPEAGLNRAERYYGYCPAPYDGYIGLDIGNHNSTIAAYTLRGARPEDGHSDPEQAWVLREPASNQDNASLQADAPAILSAVCYRSIAGDTVTDAPGAVTFLVGRQADHIARASMDGVELAAKRLIASPHFQANKEYTIQKTGPGIHPDHDESHEIGIPRRIAGELLACRLLHLFREATRRQPTRVAVSYPTTFSEREVAQLREVVHRGWLRMYPRLQSDPNLKVLKREFSGPARLTADSEGILFMLDEASAAAFFFLFNKILRADGQLSRFRYLYPQGLNLILCDCGGGTTDIALVRALVRPNDVRKLVLTVRGRVGHRSFGGDYITEQVHRILKAKVAARLSVELLDQPLPGFPQNGTREQITTYFSRNADKIDSLIPTRFRRSEPGMAVSQDGQEKQRRSFALWRIAEDVKRELAVADGSANAVAAEKSVRIPSVVWEELRIPGVSESVRDGLENLTVSRREVDSLVEGRLCEIIEICNSLIRKKLVEKDHTGLTEEHDNPEEVHWVVAAGAACRYPLIPEMLRQRLNVPFLNSSDEEFRSSRMTIDDANLKHAVAKGLAKVLMIKDMHDIQVEFDSDLSRRLPFEIVYRDRLGLRRTLFRENAHFDTLTDSQPLIPEPEPETIAPSADPNATPGHYVVLYRRFPGEIRDTPYLKYFFRHGVDGELKVKYDPEAATGRANVSPFVMVNENTQEQGACEDLSPEELFLHPVQRGDL